MWPFKKQNPITIPPAEFAQRLPDEVLDKLLLLIKTESIEQKYDVRNGDHVVVGSSIGIATHEGVMKIKIGEESVCLYRRFDADFALICVTLNVRIKELKVATAVDRDYSGFNKEVLGL